MTRAGDDRGVVYAEFLIAFTPFFLLFLGIIQTAFIATASMVVQTAATKAARAAMVVLPDDPFFYGGEKAMLLDFKGKSDNSKFDQGLASNLGSSGLGVPSSPISGDQNLTSGFSGGGGGGKKSGSSSSSSSSGGSGGPRLSAIRLAAYLTLAALGPDPKLLAAWVGGGFGLNGLGNLGPFSDLLPSLGKTSSKNPFSLRKTAIGEKALLRFAMGYGFWNGIGAAINFPVAPFKPELRNGGDKFSGQVEYKREELVTVRVTYLFPCGVPLVNVLLCDQLSSSGDSELMDEMKAGITNPSVLDALRYTQDAHFYVLRREATMPVQWASYCYPTDKECKP